MALIAIPLIVGAQFLGQPIMTAIAGEQFADSGKILQILIFAVAAIFLGTMFSHAVIALDRQKNMIGYYVFTSLSAAAAYLILIPKYSYFGAAAVTVYSEVLIAIFSAVCVFKYSRFRPKILLSLKSLASAAIMGLTLYGLSSWSHSGTGGLIGVIFIASAVYFIALYLLGGIKRADLETILKRQKKSSGPAYTNPNF